MFLSFVVRKPLNIVVCMMFIAVLNGCFLINGPLEKAKETNAPDLGYVPIGIPFLFGGHGTSVPLTKELSLTAKHVASISYHSVVAYHPKCDVAIVKKQTELNEFPPLGVVNSKDNVFTYGMGLLGDLLVGKGIYYQDVNFVDSHIFKACPASITDAAIQSGMSGGGVYNAKGELVGIISGMSSDKFHLLDGTDLGNERTSVFVSTLHVKEWILSSVADFYSTRAVKPSVNMSQTFKAFQKENEEQNTDDQHALLQENPRVP